MENKKLRLWHISDTHGLAHLLTIPEDIDIVIHSGDSTNWKDEYKNHPEFENFIYWYSRLPIKYKIYVAGNHDSAIERNIFDCKSLFKLNNIIYLENSVTEIEGIKIFGTPYTPTFGNWCFMKNRAKMHEKVWEHCPEDSDIVICHGPPKGILDLSYSPSNQLEYCGDGAFKKKMLKIQPKLCLFGHIHNCEDIINAGWTKLSTYSTIFSNGSVVTDGKFGQLSSNGNIFEI